MSEAPKRILVDTNVWLDYFIPSRCGRSAAMRVKTDLLVTNDTKLCSHAPVAAMNVENARKYLAAL